MSDAIYALIMAGGSGTRFWPASRRHRPKQLLALAGDEPLLQQAVDRVADLCGRDRVWIATGRHLEAATRELLPDFGPEQLLVEPVARNTAPCIGWAAAKVARADPEAVIVAVPSDPYIRDGAAYRRTLETAVESARRGVITTVGITPTHPETGYGYVEVEPGDGSVLDVRRFVEKPDQATAERYVQAGNYYWNAGMFIFRACDMTAAVAAHMPELHAGLAELDAAAADGREHEVLPNVFARLPATSIDYGVMEHMDRLACVPGDFGWTDLGSWTAAHELARKDDGGNHAPAQAVLIDAHGNYVLDTRAQPTSRVVALIGVSDLAVVQTDDALLIVPLAQAQRVREVVDALRTRGDDELV
jgi:mannose-1-phosphate guanylyltransferase